MYLPPFSLFFISVIPLKLYSLVRSWPGFLSTGQPRVVKIRLEGELFAYTLRINSYKLHLPLILPSPLSLSLVKLDNMYVV